MLECIWKFQYNETFTIFICALHFYSAYLFSRHHNSSLGSVTQPIWNIKNSLYIVMWLNTTSQIYLFTICRSRCWFENWSSGPCQGPPMPTDSSLCLWWACSGTRIHHPQPSASAINLCLRCLPTTFKELIAPRSDWSKLGNRYRLFTSQACQVALCGCFAWGLRAMRCRKVLDGLVGHSITGQDQWESQ